MEYKNILIEYADSNAYITINRPKKLNALNKETIAELHDAFDEVEHDKNVRVIILTGSGEKAFVAGADISEFANFNASQGAKLARKGQETLFSFVENLQTPVIAAVNGFALGGGLELAMACHFRVAKGKAMEMIMTAGMISAADAKNHGLVNYVVSQEELIPLCEKLADKITKNSGSAISAAIKAINANFKDGVDGFGVEIDQFGNCFGTKDFIEGTTAFLEKRKAKF